MRRRRLLAAALFAVIVGTAGCVAAPTGGQRATPTSTATGTPATSPTGTQGVPTTVSTPPTPTDAPDYAALYRQTIDSVVMIRVSTDRGVVGGSGFVYDGRGHVVTNQHVVGDTETVEVRFRHGEWRSGTVVGADAYTDLAVVAVEDPPSYAAPLPVARSLPRPGERVIALGSPFGLEGSVTSGIVSGVNRTMPTQNGFTIPDTVQTDAAINPGNSGGPLVSMDGEVVGVNRATEGVNVGFAVSAKVIERVVPSLIDEGHFEHAYVGVVTLDVTPALAEANDLERPGGLLVVRTVEGGPADGVLLPADGQTTVDGRAVPTGGDVIVGVDGTPVVAQQDLSRHLMLEANSGDRVTFTIVRNGTRQTVELTLGSRPPP